MQDNGSAPESGNFELDIIRKIIWKTIWKMAGQMDQAGIKKDEFLDIAQDLFCAFIEKWPKCDAEKGHPYAFATVVVENRLSKIIRKKRAATLRADRPWR